MTEWDRALGLLGLANKAGKLKLGQDAALDAARQGKAALLLLAKDASPNTRKKILDCARFHGVRVLEFESKTLLARICSYEELSAGAVCDRRFANQTIKLTGGGTYDD